MTTPENKTVSYSYDNGNLLTRITTDLGNFIFTYDAGNRRTTRTLPNGTTSTYSYDENSRLLGIQTTKNATTIDSTTYTHDNVGNRLTKTQPGINYSYGYDPIYRITQATPTGGSHQAETYTYDQVGNRLTRANETPTTSNDTTQYTYDDENRLTGVSIQKNIKTKQLSFAYDPFGRRIAKTLIKDEIGTDCDTPNICPRTTYYVYDDKNIILEYNTSNEVTARYTHGPIIDEPLSAEIKTGISYTPYFYHADGLGSIVGLSDASGNIVQRYEYDSFGIMNITTQGNIRQPFTYTGREYDSETMFYYYRARYYDPKLGRFITRDPIGFKGGINQYSYVSNNPIRFTDPTGEIQACKRRFDNLGPILGDIWPMRHCYIVLDSGDTLGFFNDGTHQDPLPKTISTQCANVDPDDHNCSKDKKCNDNCLKQAMSGCGKWNLVTNNCCDCVRNALTSCGCKVPPLVTTPWNMY